MKVKIRQIDNCHSHGAVFTKCKFSEFHALINFVNESGGIYDNDSGEYMPIHSWQLCNDNNECYAEIILGEESDG